MEIEFDLTSVRRLLCACVVFTALAGICAEVANHLLELPNAAWSLEQLFSLSQEENFPTWVSSALLLCCSLALGLVASGSRKAAAPYVGHWWILALIFACISFDEVAQLHEELSLLFDYEGVLFFGWVIPAGIFVAAFALSYLRFLLDLPAPARSRMVVAGSIYVAGALGLELPLGYWTTLKGNQNFVYAMIDVVGETLELIGTSLFLYALLLYLGAPSGRLLISFGPGSR